MVEPAFKLNFTWCWCSSVTPFSQDNYFQISKGLSRVRKISFLGSHNRLRQHVQLRVERVQLKQHQWKPLVELGAPSVRKLGEANRPGKPGVSRGMQPSVWKMQRRVWEWGEPIQWVQSCGSHTCTPWTTPKERAGPWAVRYRALEPHSSWAFFSGWLPNTVAILGPDHFCPGRDSSGRHSLLRSLSVDSLRLCQRVIEV